jgi:hypothetical protein
MNKKICVIALVLLVLLASGLICVGCEEKGCPGGNDCYLKASDPPDKNWTNAVRCSSGDCAVRKSVDSPDIKYSTFCSCN